MRADCTAAAGVGSSGIVARVLSLITVALTVGLADSLNPSKVGPALYLAIGKKAVRRVAAFTLGVFAVSFCGGASGSARGGGIYDGLNPDGPPGGPLVLQNSNVTANTLSGTGLLFQGGGIYLQDNPITLTNSAITQNVPDQCFGC
jgi:hypothetical protein